MEPDQLVEQYPQIYHMAELDNWPNIRGHGLLSTSALLDLFEIQGPARFKIESQWRPNCEPIRHPSYGMAVIRDQIPMPEHKLKPLLDDDVTPQQWYELINRKTYFWADRKGLELMLNAYQYRNRSHCVLTVDTRSLIDRHLANITLTDINSGSCNKGERRGLNTFKKIDVYHTRWVKEIAVDYSVPDIACITLKVEEYKGSNMLKLIWER